MITFFKSIQDIQFQEAQSSNSYIDAKEIPDNQTIIKKLKYVSSDNEKADKIIDKMPNL